MEAESFDLSIRAAAAMLKSTELNILMHIKRGKLVAHEINGQWYLSRKDIDNYLTRGKDSKNDVLCTISSCSRGCGSCV